MPAGMIPALSPADEAQMEALLADPVFEIYADLFMDMEFGGTGLCDTRPDLETDPAYVLAVKIALHNAAIARLEPGEPAVAAYRIARESVADLWLRDILAQQLLERYRAALADDNFSTAMTIWEAIATTKYGTHRRQLAQTRAAV